MMEELRASNSTHHQRVFISMVSILREQDGTRMKRGLRNLNQRSFTTLSQFFTFLLFLLQLVVINQDNQIRRKKNFKTWKRSRIIALSTSILLEMIDI